MALDGPDNRVDGKVKATNGANGYDNEVLDKFKCLARFPEVGWFALTGAVDRDGLFPIKTGCDYTPTQTGEFGCFANDAWGRYENDKGRLVLSVERIA